MLPHNHPDRCPFRIQIPIPQTSRLYPYQCKLRAGHTQPHDSVVLTRSERQLYAELLRVVPAADVPTA